MAVSIGEGRGRSRHLPAVSLGCVLWLACLTPLAVSGQMQSAGGAPMYSDLFPRDLPEPPPDSASNREAPDSAGFLRWYRQSNSPRTLIFWGQSLSERPSDRVRGTTLTRESRIALAGNSPEGPVDLTGESVSRQYAEHNQPRAPSSLFRARVSPDVRSSFESRLLSEGVRLVDRDLSVRLLSAASDGSDGGIDMQKLETQALLTDTDLLVQIVPTAADDPARASFLLTVHRIADKRLLATFTSDQLFLSHHTTSAYNWRASPGGGFEKAFVPAPPLSDARIGRELADELMLRLSRLQD